MTTSMPKAQEIEALRGWLLKCSQTIYLATEESVAREIGTKLVEAASAIGSYIECLEGLDATRKGFATLGKVLQTAAPGDFIALGLANHLCKQLDITELDVANAPSLSESSSRLAAEARNEGRDKALDSIIEYLENEQRYLIEIKRTEYGDGGLAKVQSILERVRALKTPLPVQGEVGGNNG